MARGDVLTPFISASLRLSVLCPELMPMPTFRSVWVLCIPGETFMRSSELWPWKSRRLLSYAALAVFGDGLIVLFATPGS